MNIGADRAEDRAEDAVSALSAAECLQGYADLCFTLSFICPWLPLAAWPWGSELKVVTKKPRGVFDTYSSEVYEDKLCLFQRWQTVFIFPRKLLKDVRGCHGFDSEHKKKRNSTANFVLFLVTSTQNIIVHEAFLVQTPTEQCN